MRTAAPQLEGISVDWQPLNVVNSWGSMHVVAVAKDANVFHKSWSPRGTPNWSAWSPAAGMRAAHEAGVAVVSRLRGHLDAFVVNPDDGRIYHSSWNELNWVGASPFMMPSFDYKPKVDGPFDLCPCPSGEALQARGERIFAAGIANINASAANQTYLDEAYYFVAQLVALRLQDELDPAALDWYRMNYDYSAPPKRRRISWLLLWRDALSSTPFSRPDHWLLDPLNPHLIAATRRDSYTRSTKQSIIRCLNGLADAQFTIDTSESNNRARTLYMTAQMLLDQPELRQQPDCDGWKVQLDESKVPESIKQTVAKRISRIDSLEARGRAGAAIVAGFSGVGEGPEHVAVARRQVAEIASRAAVRPRLGQLRDGLQTVETRVHRGLMAEPALADASYKASAALAREFSRRVSAMTKVIPPVLDEEQRIKLPQLMTGRMLPFGLEGKETAAPLVPGAAPVGAPPSNQPPGIATPMDMRFELDPEPPIPWTPAPSYAFCIPANPVVDALRRHVELSLYKLRHCLNIAGMHRDLEPYSAPTDIESGLPSIGATGQLNLPGVQTFRPTPYRYATLIERAKQLVQIAAQMEGSMLSALEKADVERYTAMKARQDSRVAHASVQLNQLRVGRAQSGVKLAALQRDRASIQLAHFGTLLSAGLSTLEEGTLAAQALTVGARAVAAANFRIQGTINGILSFGIKSTGEEGKAASQVAELAEASAGLMSTEASFERRKQEWELQQSLSNQDVAIGNQNIEIAVQDVAIAGQELNIASLQSDNSDATIEFLATKFTNADLYDWMSGILQSVYRYFLQQATAMARLAAYQIAFHRQEAPTAFIQNDYWTAPSQGSQNADAKSADRRGLTGSARLLQDIYQLDQYAFQTERRKLQLSTTISLVSLDPYQFQRFRETGLLSFRVPMELFDREFPGQYLRLIRRVRVSVIALTPPNRGIRATLTNSGITRVVVGGDVYQSMIVRRDPEMVALTSPVNATGLFELDAQSELLLPFEDLGVEGTWELRLPRASNPWDFRSLADVLVSIDYTALHSFDYEQEMLASLTARVSQTRGFSFRSHLPDPWYDLHNPDQTDAPMTVRFRTSRSDFPPNLERLRIRHVAVYFARRDGAAFEVPALLRFKDEESSGFVGGLARTRNGMGNTRLGNAAAWTPMVGRAPFGEWELGLPNSGQIRNHFKRGEVEDIMLAVTVSGETPAWPR